VTWLLAEVVIVFEATQRFEQLIVSPAAGADLAAPRGEVGGGRPHEVAAVDRPRPADHPAAHRGGGGGRGQLDRIAPQQGRVVEGQFGAVAQGGREAVGRGPHRTGFQQPHVVIRVLAQPGGEHATRAAAADDQRVSHPHPSAVSAAVRWA
jgi:hypothetical protein